MANRIKKISVLYKYIAKDGFQEIGKIGWLFNIGVFLLTASCRHKLLGFSPSCTD